MKTGLLFVAIALTVPMAHAQTTCGKESTRLFGEPLACAKRTTFRAALTKAGAIPTREDDHYLCDLYDPKELLDGADKLTVCYTATSAAAEVSYRIPAFVDPGRVSTIRSLVASKYGPPQRASGDPRLGPVTYEWRRQDTVNIVLSRGWPDTTVYLEFRPREMYTQFERVLKETEREEKAAAAARQTESF